MEILDKDISFYPCIMGLFLCDIISFALWEQQIVCLLLCLYILMLYKKAGTLKLCALIVLISLESSCFYGRFGLQLLSLIPATFIGFQSQKVLYSSRLQPYLLLFACLLAHYFLIESYVLARPVTSNYTFVKIIANIIVLWCISLIDNSQGKLGSRSDMFKRIREESPDS